jgi:FAD:protein FMN transferase
VPRLLADLVAAALDAAAKTDGAVEPTLGLAMCDIGYDRDITDITTPGRGLAAARHAAKSAAAGPRRSLTNPSGAGRARRSWRDVRLDTGAALLTVPTGSALDLGASAKAFTADLAARTLSARYGTPVLVELGGDLAVAGHRPEGWSIWVAERSGGNGQSVQLSRGGLATSTTTVRRWSRDGRLMHHIVDPRTGAPAAGPWRTASVFAESALAANTASTAAIVLGADAFEWLTARGIAARLVDQDGRPTLTQGWPSDRVLEMAR